MPCRGSLLKSLVLSAMNRLHRNKSTRSGMHSTLMSSWAHLLKSSCSSKQLLFATHCLNISRLSWHSGGWSSLSGSKYFSHVLLTLSFRPIFNHGSRPHRVLVPPTNDSINCEQHQWCTYHKSAKYKNCALDRNSLKNSDEDPRVRHSQNKGDRKRTSSRET